LIAARNGIEDVSFGEQRRVRITGRISPKMLATSEGVFFQGTQGQPAPQQSVPREHGH
jgi:hypothetical protein